MKNIVKVFFVYLLGLMLVLSLVWRVDTLDNKNKSVVDNDSDSKISYIYE